MMANIILIVYIGAWIFPHIQPPSTLAQTDLYYINALYINVDTGSIIRDIQGQDPDYIAIVELSPELHRDIQEAGYIELAHLMDDARSVGLYTHPRNSYYPDVQVTHDLSYPVGVIGLEDVTIYVVHPFPPFIPALAKKQRQHFESIQAIIEEHKKMNENFLMVGDFNSTLFSPVFQKYFGEYEIPLRLTWKKNLFFQLPIDHVISNIAVDSYIGPQLSSDHRPIYVDL